MMRPTPERPDALRRTIPLLLAITAFASGCLKEPVAPTWDVDLTAPLARRSYTLGEVVEQDTSMLRVGEGGQILYTSRVQTSPTYVGDMIRIAPFASTGAFQLGAFAITMDPSSVPVSIPFLPPGATLRIPDTTVTLADLRDTMANFQRATFSAGTLTLTVRNNLPVAVDLARPIELRDAFNTVVATFTFSPATIPPGGSRSASAPMEGRSVTSVVVMTGLRIHLNGSTGPVTVPSGPLLVADLTGSGLAASQAVLSQVPAQILTDNDTTSLQVNDSTLVREVRLGSGTVALRFSSLIDLDMVVRFRFLELQRLSGSAFVPAEDSVYVPARGTGTYAISLAGHRMISLDGDFVRRLRGVSSVRILGSARPVTVNDTDRVRVELTTTAAVVADSAIGVLKPTRVHVDRVIGMDFGSLPQRFTGTITIPDADLVLRPIGYLGFPMNVGIQVGARRVPGNDSVYLQLPPSQGRGVVPGSVMVFDPAQVGQFLTQISGRLPDSLRVVGDLLVNPPEFYQPTLAGIGSVGRNSMFSGDMELVVPLRLTLSGGRLVDTVAVGDTTGDGRGHIDLPTEITDDMNSGTIVVEVENGLPLSVTAEVALLDRARGVLLRLPGAGGSIQAAAPPVDGGGNVTGLVRARSSIALSKADLRLLERSERLVYTLAFATTGTSLVRFRAGDSVRIRAWATFSYRVEP